MHAMGAPRIHTQLKIGSRTDRSQSLQDKIDSVQQHLQDDDRAPN
ncbi:MAG: thiamine-binding protein [Spongiibacter sp.]|nr:thiamine-binding protein [Spongiibacter sp.]